MITIYRFADRTRLFVNKTGIIPNWLQVRQDEWIKAEIEHQSNYWL